MIPQSLRARLLISCAAFVVALVPLGVALFYAISAMFSCPPAQPQCDLPEMAALGVTIVTSPLLAGVLAVMIFRILARRSKRQSEINDSGPGPANGA